MQTTRSFLYKAWNKAIGNLAAWTITDLVPALVYGGLGIKGITSTQFWHYINSNDGLSQLGIRPGDTDSLLKAYIDSFTVRTQGRSLIFRFGDEAELKYGTPHWASGTGKLKVKSWLQWIVDEESVGDGGYVDRNNLPPELQDRPRLDAPLGGLMLPRGRFGSRGYWRFDPKLRQYHVDWLQSNMQAIEAAIGNEFEKLMQHEVS